LPFDDEPVDFFAVDADEALVPFMDRPLPVAFEDEDLLPVDLDAAVFLAEELPPVVFLLEEDALLPAFRLLEEPPVDLLLPAVEPRLELADFLLVEAELLLAAPPLFALPPDFLAPPEELVVDFLLPPAELPPAFLAPDDELLLLAELLLPVELLLPAALLLPALLLPPVELLPPLADLRLPLDELPDADLPAPLFAVIRLLPVEPSLPTAALTAELAAPATAPVAAPDTISPTTSLALS